MQEMMQRLLESLEANVELGTEGDRLIATINLEDYFVTIGLLKHMIIPVVEEMEEEKREEED